jgi:hypothetical protein
MKNVWKGLAVGGVVGAVVGVTLDGGARAGRRLSDTASSVGSQAATIPSRFAETDLAGKVADAGHRAAASNAAQHLVDAAHGIADHAVAATREVGDAIEENRAAS